MAQTNSDSSNLAPTLQRQASPVPPTEVHSPRLSLTLAEQRQRSGSKEELSCTAATYVSTHSPPATVMSDGSKHVEPLMLPSSGQVDNADKRSSKWNATDSSTAAPQVFEADYRKSYAPTGEKEEGDAEARETELSLALDDQPISRDFQCPQVPPMVIALLVFTALVQGFSAGAISLFINMELRFGPVEVTRYWMYVGYTAWCQPAIGYLSDAMVIFGEKRRPLFIVAALGNTVVFLLYCFVPAVTSSYGEFIVVSIISQFFTMGLYIPLNGLIVEVGRHDAETEEESMARMSAIMFKTMVWRSIGSLMGNILQTCLVIKLSVRPLLGITGLLFFLLILIVVATPKKLFLRSGAQDQNFYKRVAEAGRLVWRSFDIHDIRSDGFCFVLVLVFVFVYTMMPDASSVYYNYLYGNFSFPTWFYALNNCIGYLGSIAGAYVFSLWMDHRARQEARGGGARTSLFFIFMIGSFAWAFGYVTNLLLCTGFITNTLGIRADIYVPVDNFFMSMFVRFAFMPTITMAAEHAPKYFEATTFEVFSVASIGGGTISSLLTSILAQDLGITRKDYSSLPTLILISIVLKLVPIPLAYVLPERRMGLEELPTGDDEHNRAVGAGSGDEGTESNVPAGARAATEDEGSKLAAVAAVVPQRRIQVESLRASQDSEEGCDPSAARTQHRRLSP